MTVQLAKMIGVVLNHELGEAGEGERLTFENAAPRPAMRRECSQDLE